MPFIPDPEFQKGFAPDVQDRGQRISFLRTQAQGAEKEAGKSVARRFLGELPKQAVKQTLGLAGKTPYLSPIYQEHLLRVKQDQ